MVWSFNGDNNACVSYMLYCFHIESLKMEKTTNCISQSITGKLTDCIHCHEMQLRFTRTAEYFDARCNIKHFDICFKKNTWLNRHHCGQLRNCPLQKKPDHQVLSMLSQGIIVLQTKHMWSNTKTATAKLFERILDTMKCKPSQHNFQWFRQTKYDEIAQATKWDHMRIVFGGACS